MPTYEYKCDACGFEFEKFQSITAEPIKKCPNCGKSKVRRVSGTGAGLIFKGSGFYLTDYRDASYKEKAKAESGAASDAKPAGTETKAGGAAEAGKSDAKPAETAPVKSGDGAPATGAAAKAGAKPAKAVKKPKA